MDKTGGMRCPYTRDPRSVTLPATPIRDKLRETSDNMIQ